MYSRRIKVNKKKPKPTRQKQTPGSNWGPRLALIERERALAGGGVLDDEEEEELYEIHHELAHSVKKPSVIAGVAGPPPGRHFHNHHSSSNSSNNGRSNNDVDPVLRLGRSSSPNYFYYNYSRRTAPNANSSSQMRKISCPEPSSTSRMQAQPNMPNHLQHQQQHQRRASYVLGASSGYCSGSVTTLSTCANNDDNTNFQQFTKPLTLIIPSQENKYEDYSGKVGKRQGGKLQRQKYVTEGFATEELSQDSFPSSSAYQSSGDEEGSGRMNHQRRSGQGTRQFHNPMAHMNTKKTSGILQISTKEVVQIHPQPNSPSVTIDDTVTEPETLEMGADEDSPSSNVPSRSKTGSTITALSQGVTMVYVPMGASNDNYASKDTIGEGTAGQNESRADYDNELVDLPELGQHSDDCSASTSSSCRGSGKEPEDSLSSNFILKKKIPDHSRSQQTTCALDSLLDSFESVMFKPKPGEVHRNQDRAHTSGQTSQQGMEQKGIRKRPEQPPPLPPANKKGGNGKQGEKQKNLRFALENLETVLNPSRATSIEDQSEHQGKPVASSPPKKVLKKVTLSLPGADNISSRNHELLLNYEELNNCASEVLSCGHVKNDDYSTISSMTSSPQEMSDFDDIESNPGNNSNAGDILEEMMSNNGISSGGESDMGSSGGGKTKSVHEPRSVLQQLRDLSRLIRGSSPTKPPIPVKSNRKDSQENNSFFLHNNNKRSSTSAAVGHCEDTEVAKRKTSDATDNSADSGKGSGSGSASASGSSGQEGSSSSAEPSPSNPRGGVTCNGKPNQNGGSINVKLPVHSKRLKVATIRGRGGGTRSTHHYTLCADEHCQQGADDSCSQQSSCSCQDCCDYQSDCNECRRIKNSAGVFIKPSNSEELCSNSNDIGRKKQIPPPPHKTGRPVVSKIVRRTSSRIRGSVSARRTASLRRANRTNHHGTNSRKPVILDYCDCSNCDLDCGEYEDFEEDDDPEGILVERHPSNDNCCQNKQRSHPLPQSARVYHEPLLIPVNLTGSKRGSSKCKTKSRSSVASTGCSPSSGSISDRRKISTSSVSSGISSSSSAGGKLSRISALRSSSNVIQQQHNQSSSKSSSQLLRQSDAASAGAAIATIPISVGPSTSTGNLFTIDEANEESVYGEGNSGAGAVIIGKGGKSSNNGSNGGGSTTKQQPQPPPKPDFQVNHHHHHNHSCADENINEDAITLQMTQRTGVGRTTNPRNGRSSQHSHPKCWLAPDATLGWSDLESLYSQNMKLDGKRPTPGALRDECPTCWKELSEMKKNCPDPTRTVDRTKRMFIWLNRRHKEFHAPWWEAKKQASMRWLVTKAFAHAVPKDKIPDPFKESKKGKPAKYSLREDIVKGLVSGKLYCMALDALYRSQQNNYHLNQNLTHWEIIKILSRRGIYIAQPSDMKLTEATLRQKKPIRTAAHIALIEAMMGLYAKEILGRDRIAATLRSFGRIIDPDTNSPERLVISWINTAVTTLKSYILSNAPQQLPANKVTRWLNLPDVGEIRDLCDGVGVCALFALYCSNDLKVEEIAVPEPGDTLTIYDSITNHSLVQKLCEDLFPEPIYHLCVTDFLYIHGCMKQNILCFLVDLFVHLEINPILRVNRLTHVPIRVEL